MPLVGIIAKKKEIEAIRKEIKEKNIEIIEITKESIANIKNVKLDEIVFLQNIKLEDSEYKYMNEIISHVQYLILNKDIEIETLKKLELKKPIKLITFGFNSKATITVSSVTEDKIIICLQRDIKKLNGEILEYQEKEILGKNSKKIYNTIAIFIIKELHNL